MVGVAVNITSGVEYFTVAGSNSSEPSLRAKYWSSNIPAFDDIARLEAIPGLTDLVLGRGIWDMINLGIDPEDLRVQLQFFLAEARRRLPAVKIHLYATAFVHLRMRPGATGSCNTLSAQLVYRDALYAAAANFNADASVQGHERESGPD